MTNCRVDICHCHSTYAAVGLQFPVIVLEKKRPTEARSLFLCLIDQRITVVLYLFNQLVNSVIFLSSLPFNSFECQRQNFSKKYQIQYQTYKY